MVLPETARVREWTKVDAATLRDEIIPLGQPAILRGAASHWPAVDSARDSLASYLRGFDLDVPCDVLIGAPGDLGRFFYGRHYGVMNFQQRRATLAALLDRLEQAAAEPAPPTLAAQALPIRALLPGFAEANRLALLDEAVEPRLWIGNRIVVACHYDTASNIACNVAGRRRFTLFPPDQVGNLYIGPYESTPAGAPISLVDFDQPDLDRFPAFAEAMAHAQLAELAPGDALYIPYMWWHHVRSLDAINLLVNYWWNEAETAASPVDAFMLGLLALRDLPEAERAAWRGMFERFVFRADGDPMAHLPSEAQGLLGRLDPQQAKAFRARLADSLAR
ncbi:cupin-like domain-containing protein [Nostoc sp. 3335mG]|nr:cupin-like domain-containing protein [Nostoc sp. 3335mG]